MLLRKESRLAIGIPNMDLNDALAKTTVLQSKLYQTAQRDSHRRFHRLYDKLFREDVLWSAWFQVRANGGAPGIDGVSVESLEAQGIAAYLVDLAEELRRQDYRPQPVRRVSIPKGNGQLRSLGIPTVRDRIVQTAAKLVLEPIFEADFHPCSYGFRPGVGQWEALASVHQTASSGYRFVVDADIEGFFDHLDHDQMMASLRRRVSDGAVLRLLYRWLKAGVMVGCFWERSDAGTPQGGVISPLLANVYLHGLDEAFGECTKGFVGRLTRYADDLLIQCGTRSHAERALQWLVSSLLSLGLRLSVAKTSIVEDSVEGFDFLGFHHRRVSPRSMHGKPPSASSQSSGKARILNLRWPSRRACQKFRAHLKTLLQDCPRVQTASDWRFLVGVLNRYLRGWGSYFRRGQGRSVLSSLDWYVQERVARYLCRCQPHGKKRQKRPWRRFLEWLQTQERLVRLSGSSGWKPLPARGLGNVRWKAV